MAIIKTLSMDADGIEGQNQTEDAVLISYDSAADYLKSLKEIFVIKELPPWNPDIRSKTIMRQAPKRIYVDPSLAISALGVNREHLLRDLETYGFMFENLCLRDIAVYTSYFGGKLFHYHDNSGLEVDAIVELPNGSWGAFEIKLGEKQVEAAVKVLFRLKEKMIKAEAEPPVCLAVITGGGIARLRDDGVYVLPINAIRH
jgi:predicted AAA+ superfamily ATPase